LKSAPTATLTETLLYDVIGGAVSKPRIKTQYYDTVNSTWASFDDIQSREINLSTENKRYQAYSFLPPVKTIKFTLNNFNQIYSIGSGNAKATILKKNLLVRAYTGYQLTAGQTTLSTDNLISNNELFHTIKSGSTIIPSSNNITDTYLTAAQLGTSAYGSSTYGSGAYAYASYYKKTFTTDEEQQPLALNCNVSTNKFSLKYKLDMDAWSSYQTLATGANEITLVSTPLYKNVQTIVRFNTDSYATASHINSLALSYDQKSLYFKRGTFIIDEPFYNETVEVVGRDYLRKALETEINLPTYLSSTPATTILTNILDRCNIPYATSTWDSISTATQITSATAAQALNNISGWKALDYAMDIINAGDNDIIFTFDNDGKAVIRKVPTDVEADWMTHYRYNIESIDKSFDSDKQLQRITAVNKDIIVNSEALLKTVTGTISTYGNLTATYSDALYIRYDDNNSNILTESARTNGSVSFTMTAGAYDIDIYGCTPKNAITDEIWSEFGNSDNLINNKGSTFKKINPMLNQTASDAYVKYMIATNADPKKSITLSQVPNPLTELGKDKWVIFDRYTYTDDLYIPQQINEIWNMDSGLKETVTLKDSGDDLSNFIWDRNGIQSGLNDLKYDIGLVWDQDIAIGVSDTTDYTGTKEVQFS